MKRSKIAILIVAIMTMTISITAFAGTTTGTTTKDTPKTVAVTISPYSVSISYDVGSFIPTDNARIYGSASASTAGKYVRLYGKFTNYTDLLDKSKSDASASVSVSGSVELSGVDEAVGTGYAEARTGISPFSTIGEKVTLSITD